MPVRNNFTRAFAKKGRPGSAGAPGYWINGRRFFS